MRTEIKAPTFHLSLAKTPYKLRDKDLQQGLKLEFAVQSRLSF